MPHIIAQFLCPVQRDWRPVSPRPLFEWPVGRTLSLMSFSMRVPQAYASFNTLRFVSQLHSGIAGPDDVSLRSTAQMPQFTVEASWRVSIQQLRCAAEFRQVPEERAEDSLCKGSAARTLAHAALTLSNADRCVAVSPLYSVELARLRVHAFIDCGLCPPQKGNGDVPVAQTAQSVN